MKPYIYFCMMLFSIHAYPQVGINTNTPDQSSVLHINSSNKGVLLPQYDLITATSNVTPIANPANGLVIYNKGGLSTLQKGYYIWIRDQWYRTLIAGSEPQIMSLSIGAGTMIPKGSTNNILNRFTVTSNKITGASLGADTSTITLPAGTYILRYSVDNAYGTTSTTPANTTYFSTIIACTRTYLVNAATSAAISEMNRMCESSGNFTFFQGTFYLKLTAPTTIRQKFEFDTGNGFNSDNLNVRSSLALIITKMPS